MKKLLWAAVGVATVAAAAALQALPELGFRW